MSPRACRRGLGVNDNGDRVGDTGEYCAVDVSDVKGGVEGESVVFVNGTGTIGCGSREDTTMCGDFRVCTQLIEFACP